MPPKTDMLVTVFGGGGFLGRYVAQSLLKTGVRIRVAERDPRRAWFLKPLGGLGQVQFVRADVTDKAVGRRRGRRAPTPSINLVGILKGAVPQDPCRGRPQRRRGRRRGRRAGARPRLGDRRRSRRARAPMAAPRARASRRSAPPSRQATIIRPSIAFGQEDDFVNRFARMARLMPILPVIRPAWRLQPVHVADLGKAIALAALDPERPCRPAPTSLAARRC